LQRHHAAQEDAHVAPRRGAASRWAGGAALRGAERERALRRAKPPPAAAPLSARRSPVPFPWRQLTPRYTLAGPHRRAAANNSAGCRWVISMGKPELQV